MAVLHYIDLKRGVGGLSVIPDFCLFFNVRLSFELNLGFASEDLSKCVQCENYRTEA